MILFRRYEFEDLIFIFQGLRFLIQSDRHPEYLMTRIEAFLVYLRELLLGLTPEEFDRHREALAALRLEKPKKLHAQTIIYWNEITSQQVRPVQGRSESELRFTLIVDYTRRCLLA